MVYHIITSILLILNVIILFKISDQISAQIEVLVRKRITDARLRYEDFASKNFDKLKDDELTKLLYKSIEEDLLNAYDEACQKYLAKVINSKRFKDFYFNEIIKIMECDGMKDTIEEKSNNYQAFIKTYNKWSSEK